jgi:hypothetical protein
MKKRTLVDRMIARDKALVHDALTTYGHIRAELDRLARQVRKLRSTPTLSYPNVYESYLGAIDSTLGLIREARR